MPPFSGKKKKEQLQAKRQRKREAQIRQEEADKLEERIREMLANEHREVTPEAIEERMAIYLQDHGGGGDPRGRYCAQPHGRKEHRRARQQSQEQQQLGGRSRGEDAWPSGSDSEDGDSEENSSTRAANERRHRSGGGGGQNSRASTAHKDDEEYRYDAHRHGVHSAFRKETQAELDARRKMNYMPLMDRDFMDAKVGIPFGRWFAMRRRQGDHVSSFLAHAANATASNMANPPLQSPSSQQPAHAKDIPEGKSSPSPVPQVQARLIVADDGTGSSLCFPFALEIPSRGWATTDATDGLDLIQVHSSKVVREHATGSAASTLAASATDSREGGRDSEDRSESEDAGSDRERTATNPKRHGKARSADATANASRAFQERVQRIEEDRFRTYLNVAENYPLPENLSGLVASSCERNLEVWRELWRAIDASDVCVLVADARYPIVHIHLGLITYLTRQACRPCVLVLNKTDLVPQPVLESWLGFISLYLTSLGLPVMKAPAAAAFMRANPREKLQRSGGTAPVVMHTFTADPTRETAAWVDDNIDVGKRRAARPRRAKMYEQLRSGQLNVAERGDHGARSDESGLLGEPDDAYDASVNFKDQAKVERSLQTGKREFNELKIVSAMITQLLETCRSLAPHGKGARKETAPATATVNAEREGTCHSDESDTESKERGKKARGPIAAPLRRGKKKNQTSKATGKRGPHTFVDASENDNRGTHGPRRRGGRKCTSGCDNHDHKNDNRRESSNSEGDSTDEDVLDEREDDDASFLHISFIGYPNVGKSSLLNCIRGTKIVSVSATPGHTKHLQTIPIPSEGVTLVDSPGLVTPYYGLPRPLEAVLGTHQIAQTRDPQSGVAFLASHLPLELIYGLRRPEGADEHEEWSAYELCEAYAKKRGYFVKHGKGALDIHRSAISILQEAYQGRLTLFFAPPELNYLQSKHYLENVKPHLLLPVFRN